MTEVKKIASISVIDPGSKPDVDTDFHTEGRAQVVEYLTNKYGEGSVSNIATMGTFKAKQAFKDMCAIYEKNFQASNKLTGLIPEPQEGEALSLHDIFDPTHFRYDESEEFRQRVSDPDWKPIIEGAMGLEGRIRATGVHACGIIMSSRSLEGVLPTQVRQKDNKVISQWVYESCEAIGLTKMDLLGLDTIDLIERTLEYIGATGKEVPVLENIINGNLDDKKTFDMIRRGETIGVFQIGKDPSLRHLLQKIDVDNIEDIIATTALYRPGPMGMNSHIKYAERKNGIEEVDYVHPDFNGTVMEEILKSTYGLVVFQEQILQIANKIGGMTLQEGDKLRKAMGKKKKDVMDAMKPKFFEGGMKRGFSEKSLNVLWETMVPFAKYAFNRSHSASYAIMAYLTAYLKANYPVEFMASVISGNIVRSDKKELTLELMKESHRLGIRIGPVDINESDVMVSPAVSSHDFDIVLGFSGIKIVSETTSRSIVEERVVNGRYSSPQDFIKRNVRNGIVRKPVYVNLALAGAFDSFGYTRSSIVDSIDSFLKKEKESSAKGESLFDLAGINVGGDTSALSKDKKDEYPFSDKLKKEASMCGLYISAHPLDYLGEGLLYSGKTRIADILDDDKSSFISSYKKTPIRLVGAITDIEIRKTKSNNKRYFFTIDDQTGYTEVNASSDIVKAFEKNILEQEASSRRAKENGSQKSNLPLYAFGKDEKQRSILKNEKIPSIAVPSVHDIYILECEAIRNYDKINISVFDVIPLKTDPYGVLPVRVRLTLQWLKDMDKLKRTLAYAAKKFPGDRELWIANVSDIDTGFLASGFEMDIPYKDTGLRVSGSREMFSALSDVFSVDNCDLGIRPFHS